MNDLWEHYLVVFLLREIEWAENDVKPHLVFIFIAANLSIDFFFELCNNFLEELLKLWNICA